MCTMSVRGSGAREALIATPNPVRCFLARTVYLRGEQIARGSGLLPGLPKQYVLPSP